VQLSMETSMLAVLSHKLALAPQDRSADSEAGIFALLTAVARTFRERRQRALEREIGTFVEDRGGRMTDDLERQIARHF
jgi:hypothetical protein